MQTCDTLFHAAYLLTGDEATPPIHDASIAIRGKKVCAVGARESITAHWTGTNERDFGNAIILPGLINAHTHTSMTFLRGFADDMPLITWLTQKIFPIEAKLTKDIVTAGALLGFAEMLQTGTTSCLDMYLFEDAVFSAADTAGIRCYGGEGVFSTPSASCQDGYAAIEKTLELAATYANNPRINVLLSPHSVYTTDRMLLTSCIDIAKKNDIPLHIHLAESKEETAMCLKNFGTRPIQYCEDIGLFTAKTTLAHVVDTTLEELDILSKHQDVVVVHNPTSNMKLGSGIANIPEMLARNIPVALGTDGAASNNTLNMFLSMNHAALLHKGVREDPECVPAKDVFRMATQGGARALHAPHLGELQPGKSADLIVIDANSPNLMPLYNPVSHIVYAASGHEVVFTMVDGHICFDHGHFIRFSMEDLAREITELRNYILKTYA